MKLQKINFKNAKLAKEKGFTEKCKSWWTGNGKEEECLADWEYHINHTGNAENSMTYGYARPEQELLRKWLREKHNIHIELIMDGWGNDDCVDAFNLCYRAFIWQVGKPKPHPCDDIGAAEYEKILESALETALEMI